MDKQLAKTATEIFKDVSRTIRQEMADHDIPYMCFSVTVTGRTLTGDLRMVFRLRDDIASEIEVTGGDLSAVVEEFLRRFDWKRHNQTLCLPKTADEGGVAQEIEDEMPF